MVKGLRLKFVREDGQTDGENKKWHVRAFVTSVVPPHNICKSRERFEMFMIGQNHFVGYPPWCTKFTRSNSRPFCSLEVLTSRVVVTRDFLAIFGRLFDRVPVRILNQDFHHRTQRKKAHKTRNYDFGVQFSFYMQDRKTPVVGSVSCPY